MSEEEVVVVTGGSGFLGQHIVKHLLDQNQFPIREVRVFDLQPLEWVYGLKPEGYNTDVSLRHYKGDICNLENLQEAFQGATVVIHNASIIDVSGNPDTAKLQKINVNGTENVIKACIRNNIKYLLYTSSVAAIDRLGAYGATKRQAEDLVREANLSVLPNGEKLRSCCLCPVGMYGEGDTVMVGEAARITIDFGNMFCRLGDDTPRFQCVYACNTAHAFVAAIRRLRDTSSCNNNTSTLPNPAGRSIGVTDETGIKSYSQFMMPFITRATGATVSPFYIPLMVMVFMGILFDWFEYLIQPFFRIKVLFSKNMIMAFYKPAFVCPDEAREYLGYAPLYSYDVAFKKSVRYYRYKLMNKCEEKDTVGMVQNFSKSILQLYRTKNSLRIDFASSKFVSCTISLICSLKIQL